MNVRALQQADRWLGVPLCGLLTVWRKIFGRRRPDPTRAPRSILFVKLAEQGSTVLAWAALRHAVELVGRDHVYFVAFEPNRFILDALDVIPRDHVVTISVRGVPAFLRSSLAAVRRLRRLRVEAAIDLEFFSRGSAVLAFLSGAPRRVGFHAFLGAGPYRGDLLTHRLIYNAHLHTSETFRSLVAAVTCDPAMLPTFPAALAALPVAAPPPLACTDDERAAVGELIRRETGGQPPLILLNPNASDLLPLRRWPVERYVELARRLLAHDPHVVVGFTGGPDEAAGAERLVQQIGSERCVSFAGRTTLRQLLVLYTFADVLVTNDSGPAHFAALTPIEVVVLFGPETPELFGARSPRHTVLWARLPCSPCVNAYNQRMSPCRDNQCMQAITVEQVFAAVTRALARRKREPAASPCP